MPTERGSSSSKGQGRLAHGAAGEGDPEATGKTAGGDPQLVRGRGVVAQAGGIATGHRGKAAGEVPPAHEAGRFVKPAAIQLAVGSNRPVDGGTYIRAGDRAGAVTCSVKRNLSTVRPHWTPFTAVWIDVSPDELSAAEVVAGYPSLRQAERALQSEKAMWLGCGLPCTDVTNGCELTRSSTCWSTTSSATWNGCCAYPRSQRPPSASSFGE